MLFPTIEFALFALFTLSIWLWVEKSSLRLSLLVLFNALFYSYYNPGMTLYLFAWTGLIYVAARFSSLKVAAIGLAILQLVFWKAVDAKFIAFHSFGTPLGVSFFTFQGLTYLFAKMKFPAHRTDLHLDDNWSIMKLFAFIGFFPTVFSGPILRAKQWDEQFQRPVILTQKTFNYAFICICLGFFYKVCLSSIFHDYVKQAFANPAEETALNLWIGFYAYAFEIYHDFAGYSLMAIGIALLYGFAIPDNFKQPYLAINIREFWQRWHISFSTWLRDYFYIALGGSRVGLARHLFNSMLVMIVCGAWHGLSGNYLVWGALHGVGVCAYHLTKNKIKMPVWMAWIITFHYVAIGWIFFRSPDNQTAIDYLKGMLNFSHFDFSMSVIPLIVLFIACLVLQKIEPWILNREREFQAFCFRPVAACLVWSVIMIGILIISPSGMPPFIYFSY